MGVTKKSVFLKTQEPHARKIMESSSRHKSAKPIMIHRFAMPLHRECEDKFFIIIFSVLNKVFVEFYCKIKLIHVFLQKQNNIKRLNYERKHEKDIG